MADKVVVKDYKFQNLSFSGSDMIATCNIRTFDGKYNKTYSLGSLQTLSYSIHMQRYPVRAISNINAKDYVMGPRTIAGSLVFAVFNKHFAHELMDDLDNGLKPATAFLADELPPFDITISMANEYGVQARMVIYGVRLVNEGQVMSVNDIYTENTYQFVATDLETLTDQDGYSSHDSLKTRSYIGMVEKEEKPVVAKEVYIDTAPKQEEHIDLIATVMENATVAKKGTVKLKLTPAQKDGIISVKNTTTNETLSIDVSDQPMTSLFVSFVAGVYTAQYISKEKGKQSTIKSFTVAQSVQTQEERYSVPLIEDVTHNSISVYSNGFGHTLLKYAEWDTEGTKPYISLPLIGKRCIITNLKPYTRYSIYTCDSSDTRKSVPVMASTLLFNDELYDNLQRFVDFNRFNFKNGTTSEYVEMINEARSVALIMPAMVRPSDTLSVVKSKYQKMLNELRVENFPSAEAFLDELTRLSKISSICYDLITAADKLNNDSNHAKNPTAVVDQPVPEILGFMNSVMLISKDTVELDIYVINKDKSQLLTKVPKSKFTVHDSEKLSYKFTGKPCTKYFAYASDAKGQKSPRFDFYVPSDVDKTSALETYNIATKKIETQVEYVKNSLKQDFDKFKMSDDTKNRIITEQSKQVEIDLLNTPVIVSSSASQIVVDANNKDLLNNVTDEFYLVISVASEALYEVPAYKILINKDTRNVTFTADKHGIKSNKVYVIWIENENGVQVSRASTASTFPSHDDNAVNNYNIEKELYKIESLLRNKITVTPEFKTVIDSLKEDDVVNLNNIFDMLIKNSIEVSTPFNNLFSIIKAIIESYADLRHNTKRLFFTEPVLLNKTNKTITPPQNEKAIIKYITKTNEVLTTVSQQGHFALDQQYKYAIIHFVESNLYYRSGMILIDLSTLESYGYQIRMEVM